MQTKNINHDCCLRNEQEHHQPSCASILLRAHQQQQHAQQVVVATCSAETTKLNSSRGTSLPNSVAAAACHGNRSKTPVLSNNNCSTAIASITCHDSCKLETELRMVPSREATVVDLHHHHFAPHTTTNSLTQQSQPSIQQTTSPIQQSCNKVIQPNADSVSFSNNNELIYNRTDLSATTTSPKYAIESNASVQSQCTNMQPRHKSCFSSSQHSLTTLSAFVTGPNSHRTGSQVRQSGCHWESSQQPMLLCAGNSNSTTNSKTPPHSATTTTTTADIAAFGQPRSLHSKVDPPLSVPTGSLASHKQTHPYFSQSSTLPSNSTLSSLLAAVKSNDHHQYSSMQQPQQELRRQTSLSQLDKVVATTKPKCKVISSSTKGEAKFGFFQQRLKAMLSPQKDSTTTKVNGKRPLKVSSSTYRSAKDVNGQSLDFEHESQVASASGVLNGVNNVNGSVLSEVNTVNSVTNTPNSSASVGLNRPLSTLNKYTVSVSSTNLAPNTVVNGTGTTSSDCYDDSFHLRNVCSKLYSQKQYSCVQQQQFQHQHSTSDNVIVSSMQKSSPSLLPERSCFRNLTPEMNVDKVGIKENLYTGYNSSSHHNNSVNHHTPSVVDNCFRHQANNNNNNNSSVTRENHLCRSDEKQQSSEKGSERTQSYLGINTNDSQNVAENSSSTAHPDHVVVVSELDSSKQSSNNGLTVLTENEHSQSKMTHTNEGSTLSLNGAEASESVASQEHNYKSSSESGRGTMNSHLGENSSSRALGINSPADLTSLDSDQSNQLEGSWKESNSNCVRRCSDNTGNCGSDSYSKIQRYFDDQRCPNGQESELEICTEFKSKLSLHENSDSWTSLSDEPAVKKASSKSKNKSNGPKHRIVENKLKTNFSKPENCISTNLKQTALSNGLSPCSKPSNKLLTNNPRQIEEPDPKTVNALAYDKCIYSLPNKGKYRTGASFGNGICESKICDQAYGKECDNGSLSSDPESHFPDDGCSEFTDYFHQEHHDPLRKQLRGIEDMYSELLSMLNTRSDQRPRKKLYRRNSGRSSVASRNTRDYINRRYKADQRRTRTDDWQSRRYKKLESQVLTLAKSVSQLSADIQLNYMLNEEMETLRHEIEMLKMQMSNVKQSLSSTVNRSQQQQPQQNITATTQHLPVGLIKQSKESRKVDKFKRLFMDESHSMKQFLKKLGYEKYLKNFEAEKIGLAELVHLSEDRLLKLGIPMGPRIRIMQEVKNLTIFLQNKNGSAATNGGGGGKQVAAINQPESYNIYAVV